MVVIIGFIFAMAGSSQKAVPNVQSVSSTDSTIKLDKTSSNFGTISQKNGPVSVLYEATNTGDQDIYLKELYTSCACTKAQLIYTDGTESSLYTMKGMANAQDFIVGRDLKPGETVKIKAIFDPNAHGPQGIGYIKRNIMLATNSKNNPLVQVSFEANVTK